MTHNQKIAACLIVITGLVLAQGGLLMGSEELVSQLRSDIDLLLTISGAIVTTLLATVGILWKQLKNSQSAFIEELKRFREDKK